MSCRFAGSTVEFGSGLTATGRASSASVCVKNLDNEQCTLDFIKTTVAGLPVTSAADFGDHIELGLDQRFNLGMHREGFHLLSTENPLEEHQL
jgi:hypothetical protein